MALKKGTKREKINRLKIILIEKDVSVKELAKSVNKTPEQIRRICRNTSQPTLKFLRQLAKVLDVDIRELLIPTKGDLRRN